MRLPGTRYQEHGWEQVRKLLGQCSLHALAHAGPARLLDASGQDALLAEYVDTVAGLLRASAHSARAEASGNSYGDSVLELALGLACELQAHRSYWSAFAAACCNEHAKTGAFWDGPSGGAILRKKINDMFAGLRDKVDADNYQVACGRSCSPNKIYTYRMLDTAYADIARIFGAWQQHREQTGAILGREVSVIPIEARQMKSVGACKAEWIIGWSASLEQYTGSPGPLHTRSKRFASLKNSPPKIQAMLIEIADYEELSSNRDNGWIQDASGATDWLDDFWRVMQESVDGASEAADQLLAPEADEFDAPDDDSEEAPSEGASEEEVAIAAGLSLPPRFMELARAAQDRASWTARTLHGDSLPVRLAVYLKMLGSSDDTYPDEWLDPATGELPTMQQLAALDQVSLPTLRKRRDQALAVLLAAAAP